MKSTLAAAAICVLCCVAWTLNKPHLPNYMCEYCLEMDKVMTPLNHRTVQNTEAVGGHSCSVGGCYYKCLP